MWGLWFFYLVLARDFDLWVVVVVVEAVSLLGYEEKCVGLFMVVLSLEKEREMEKREKEREMEE